MSEDLEEDIPACDALRDETNVLHPDVRWKNFVVLELAGTQPITLLDRHKDVSRLVLIRSVPSEVRTHFETAKNLYLYAWFVYRFHPVAEQQALTSLELALRHRLGKARISGHSRGRRSGLSALLLHAKELGLVRNDRLTNREQWATELAQERYRHQFLLDMVNSQIDEAVIDDSHIKPSAADFSHNWIGVFVENLPKIRNMHAHGSSALYPNVLRTFDIVCDLVNQLYQDDHCFKQTDDEVAPT